MSRRVIAKNQIEESFAIIKSYPGLADFEKGVSQSDIDKAQELLRLNLSPSYICFLKELGAGDFNGREFYGIIPGRLPGTCAPSAVWFTLDERSAGSLPLQMIVIGSTGYGSLFCLDTSQTDEGEAVVVEWDKTCNGEIAKSFGEFFYSEIQSSLDATKSSGRNSRA